MGNVEGSVSSIRVDVGRMRNRGAVLVEIHVRR